MRSHISWGGERNILYKSVETSPLHTRFEILEGKPEKESSKKTISTSGGFGLLQMISMPGIGRCASEDAGHRRRVDCEIPHRLEGGMSASEDTGS